MDKILFNEVDAKIYNRLVYDFLGHYAENNIFVEITEYHLHLIKSALIASFSVLKDCGVDFIVGDLYRVSKYIVVGDEVDCMNCSEDLKGKVAQTDIFEHYKKESDEFKYFHLRVIVNFIRLLNKDFVALILEFKPKYYEIYDLFKNSVGRVDQNFEKHFAVYSFENYLNDFIGGDGCDGKTLFDYVDPGIKALLLMNKIDCVDIKPKRKNKI